MNSPGGIPNPSSIDITDVTTLRIAFKKSTWHMEEGMREATSDESIIEKILLQCFCLLHISSSGTEWGQQIYRGETVMLEFFSTNFPLLNSPNAARGQVNPFHMMLTAKGTSIIISFSVGFLEFLTSIK